MPAKISKVHAREIQANRALVALRVTVEADDGSVGVSTPETGVSTGTYEAKFLLDGGERYHGLGVRKAAEVVNKVIGPALLGIDVTAQGEIDQAMIELDGTPDKNRLGANSIVGVSLAAIKAGAASTGQGLYRYIGGANAVTIPVPILGIGTGGRYRDPGTSRWFKPSYEFVPYGAGSFENALYMSWRCAEETKRILKERFPNFAPQYKNIALAGVIDDDRQLLDVMTTAINNCGFEGQVGLYFDCAADCYYEADIDKYVGEFMPGERTREEQIALLKSYVDEFPIVSLEDPLREEDFEGIAMATEELGIEVVGDDLFTTNIERVKQGVAAGAAQSMVLKITQVGTVSEALKACRYCYDHGYNVHPCGSRGDLDSIGDFAVGLNTGQIRGADYNRLLDIEAELGEAAVWPGKSAYKGRKNRE